MEEMETGIHEVRVPRKDLLAYGMKYAMRCLPDGPFTYELVEQIDLNPDVEIGMIVLRFQRKFPSRPK